MTRLLVSVRSAAEAAAALEGGAHVIDVKEPSRGPLGRADDATIAEVVRAVAGRRPVSAALGELHDAPGELPGSLPQVRFVKWGLSTYRGNAAAAWRKLDEEARRVRALNSSCEVVPVAYADAGHADSPDVDDVCKHLGPTRRGVLLLDTFQKNGRTLLDWLNERKIRDIVDRCRAAGVRVALAGSLGFEEIHALLPLRPDWFAVRGAACEGGRRDAAIDADRVRQLVELIGAKPRSC
jgi:uncharacterized protein (UPF0264 family)